MPRKYSSGASAMANTMATGLPVEIVRPISTPSMVTSAMIVAPRELPPPTVLLALHDDADGQDRGEAQQQPADDPPQVAPGP